MVHKGPEAPFTLWKALFSYTLMAVSKPAGATPLLIR